MSEEKLDKLNELIGGSSTSKKAGRSPSRLGDSDQAFSQQEIKKATGAKASEGTAVISFRVPEHVEKLAMEAAAQQRVPYAEFKKAAFYRGVMAFAVEGEEVPMDYGRTVSAAVPDMR
jgi:hypothetical protein